MSLSHRKHSFYGKLPIIGPVVQADRKKEQHYLDLTAMMTALDNGQPVTEVDLAKVENTALSGSMPPAKYYTMHWGTNLNDDEKRLLSPGLKKPVKTSMYRLL